MLHKLILLVANHFLFAGTVAFFGIGIGPSRQEQNQAGDMGALANFSTSEGEGNITSSDNFWKSILSGDSTQISKVLGPQISGINKRSQQTKKTSSEFGNRGGGTNAGNQMADDTTRSSVDSLIAGYTGEAAGALGASGSSLLSAGANAHEAAFSEANTIQQQHEAKLNDIFKSIAAIAAAPFTGGASLGALAAPPAPGGGGTGGGDSGIFDTGEI